MKLTCNVNLTINTIAVDFFNVEVLTFKGIVRYMVLFAIDYKTRRVEILGITPQAYGDWMKQIARNLTDPMNGFCKGKSFIIMDRDPLFTQEFRDILDSCGVSPVRTTAASPNLNPFAERWVRSIKSECLNKIIIMGERHLRYCIEQYVEHYHTSRPHTGLNHDMIDPVPLGKGKIVLRCFISFVLRFYDFTQRLMNSFVMIILLILI